MGRMVAHWGRTVPITRKLSSVQRPHSRLWLSKLVEGQEPRLRAGMLDLTLDRDGLELWSSAMVDDLLVTICVETRTAFYCRVAGKTLRVANRPLDAGNRGPSLVMEVFGAATIKSIPSEVFFGFLKGQSASQATFESLWGQMAPFETTLDSLKADVSWPNTGDYIVSFAETHDDMAFVKNAASFHPFGNTSASVILIARRNNVRVGAVLAEFSRYAEHNHRASYHVFAGGYFQIKPAAIFVKRLVDVPGIDRKFRIHDALLEALEHIAPSLMSDPLSIIEGISYDFHPVAHNRGYNIHLPIRPDGYFYYWKPYFIPRIETPPPNENVLQDVRRILRTRKENTYWMVPVKSHDLRLAERRAAWAVRRSSLNTESWRQLQPGDIVLLKNENDVVAGFGRVARTKISYEKGFEAFPLWIEFDEIHVNARIPVAQHTEASWYSNASHGGIFRVPPEFGSAISREIMDQIKGASMWVIPNPYLLRQTEFEEKPRQIFLVQAATFSNIRELVKKALKPEGFDVKYYGDRNGQVIFGDIWLMLNESVAVIVDFTSKRPNVYLEYGMALVLGKPIIAITQDKDDLPSDTPELKYILYSDKLGDDRLASALPGAIRDTILDIHNAAQRSGRRSY